jgi:hypothetical protein
VLSCKVGGVSGVRLPPGSVHECLGLGSPPAPPSASGAQAFSSFPRKARSNAQKAALSWVLFVTSRDTSAALQKGGLCEWHAAGFPFQIKNYYLSGRERVENSRNTRAFSNFGSITSILSARLNQSLAVPVHTRGEGAGWQQLLDELK